MDFNSFITSLGTSLVIFLVLVLLFAWLSSRPANGVVYFPNRILRGLDPTPTRNPFAWIQDALSSSEQDVISMSGVDTAVYFVFLSTDQHQLDRSEIGAGVGPICDIITVPIHASLGILVLSGVVLLPLLLPVAATDHNGATAQSTSNGTFSDLDKLSMGNIKEKSPRLWAFIIATYLVSCVTYYLLLKAYKHVSELRAEALRSPEVKVEQFAVLVRDIPPVTKGQSKKELIDTYFKAIYPHAFYRSLMVTDNKEVNKIWQELEGYKKKLERAEAIYTQSKKEGNFEGTRPTNKTGFLGLVGEKVDSIEYYNGKINELTPKLKSAQIITLREKQHDAAVVFFTSRVIAASASQSLHAQVHDKWSVSEAPEPRQLIWTNLNIKFFQRLKRQYAVYIFVALTILFYMIPIAFISALTTLDNLKKILPFLKPVVNIGALKTILEAYLPQLALILFLALLPKFLLFLSKAEGIPSVGHAIRAASGKYFYFTVFNVFLGITLGGTLFSSLKSIEKNPNDIVTLLATTLPGNATFFLTYVSLKFFVGYGLELSRIVPLIIFHLKRKYLCKTEAEVKDAWLPGDLGYGTRIPGDMLILTIVLCYSVISPIIIPFGVVYFGLGWLILRNQALKVYVPAYETYGRMWPHIHIRIMASLLLYQVVMLGYFVVKKFYYTPFLFPLPILSLVFGVVCQKKFYEAFAHTPLEVACRELKESPNMEQVFRSFLPPSLSSDYIDDDQFEDALSQDSKMIPSV